MAAVIAMAHPQSPAPVDTTVTVEEDSAQWDCRRDGNRMCGEGAVLPDGSLAVPGDYSTPELLARCDLLPGSRHSG
jgi:hypothetical protein